MKRLIILTLIIVFTLCGCNSENTVSQKEKVQVNLPKDNTVNGYRIETSSNDKMPDKISGIDVSPNSNTATVSSSSSSSKTSSADKTTSSEKTASKEEDKNISYCGNKNSKKFHKSTCGALKNTKDENKVYLSSKGDFLENGYSACKLCKP